MSRLLARLGISYQRGREYVHSPDPDYAAKVADIAAVLRETRRSGPRGVAVYLDELTYYRHPTTAQAYAPRGQQPRAERSQHANTSTRVVATLGDLDGKVVRQQGAKVGVRELVRFYRTLRESYPQATRLYVILDNWPIHFHPDVLVALEPQEQRWKPKLSPSWPTEPTAAARRKWGHLQLPLQLLSLPSYASWENPIEKLWRWLKQEVLHLHRQASDLPQLRALVLAFLGQFEHGSQALLRYVGLKVPG
jgi:hypothetical protein